MKDVDYQELVDILDSYRQKKRYHRMKDRSFVTLGDQQLRAIASLVENAGLKKKDLASGKIELPLSEAMYLDGLAREDEGLQLVRSRRFREIVRGIRQPQEADYEVPTSLKPRAARLPGHRLQLALRPCGSSSRRHPRR